MNAIYPSSRTIGELLAEQARRHRGETYLINPESGRHYSFEEYDDLTARTAAYLSQLGIGKGSRVCLTMGNSPWYNIITHGIQRLGGVAVLANTTLLPLDIALIIQDSNSTLIITDEDTERLTDLAVERYSGVTRVLSDDVISSIDSTELTHLSFDEISTYDVAMILYTSGTTGYAKGALLTHRNIIYNAEVMAKHNGLYAKRGLNIQPPFYTDGQILMMISTLAAGGSIVQPRAFVPDEFWTLVAKYRVQFCAVMPTHLSMLLNIGLDLRKDSGSLEFILCSAAPLSSALQEEFEKRFRVPIVEGYGLTEAGSYSTCNFPPKKETFRPAESDERRIIGSVGIAIGNEMKVVEPGREAELLPGEIGEIIIRGPNVMKGYLNDPKASEDTIRDGWLYTGDLGFVNSRGFYFIRGRKRDLIIHGGQKVFARDVEDVLKRNPKILQAAVMPIKDELWGENVKAVVVLRNHCNATAEEIISYCRQHLAEWKCPQEVQFVEEMPTSPSGKIVKKDLV
jgi:long-chain acyl-CoA synthetase